MHHLMDTDSVQSFCGELDLLLRESFIVRAVGASLGICTFVYRLAYC